MWDPQHLTTISTSKACYTGITLLFCCILFIVYNVSLIVCVDFCAVICFSTVWYFVLCLIVVTLPPNKTTFAVLTVMKNILLEIQCSPSYVSSWTAAFVQRWEGVA
jgi:hypothetical protein